MSCDPETGEMSLKQVVRTFINESYELIIIETDGDVIKSTPEHPYYIKNANGRDITGLGDGWVYAKELKPGDTLLLSDGSTATVDSVTAKRLDVPVKVYNFEVEDFHTYFVGANGVLVHNACVASEGNYRAYVTYDSNHSGTPHAHICFRTRSNSLASVGINGNILVGNLRGGALDFYNNHRSEIISGIQLYYQ